MIQVAPNRSQNGLIALAVLGILGIVFLATYKPRPAEPASTAGPSPVADATSSPSPAPSTTRAFLPSPTPRITPTPTLGPCVLPDSLSRGGDTAATPKVEGRAGSILFASPVYRPSSGAAVAADDPLADWEMGLWSVPAPDSSPRLVLSAGKGMVIPLALSSNGRTAAVWWWPERRGAGQVRCASGIYALNLSGPGSKLILAGDWTVTDEEAEQGADWNWGDPTDHRSNALRFQLPRASLSADGSHLAIADRDTIDVYDVAFPERPIRHVGTCPQWAWAPAETRFVAGCEGMTSAWLVAPTCCDGLLGQRNIPIPGPPLPNGFFEDWEQGSSRAIGFTANGDIRVARIYGFATGCEGPDECHIPPPAWAVTTIDHATQEAVHAFHETTYLFDYDSRLSADASWLYGLSYGDDQYDGISIEFDSAAVRRLPLLGSVAGAAPDGSALYGVAEDEAPSVVLRSLTPSAATDLVTISWPDSAVVHTSRIPVLGLFVGAALP